MAALMSAIQVPFAAITIATAVTASAWLVRLAASAIRQPLLGDLYLYTSACLS